MASFIFQDIKKLISHSKFYMKSFTFAGLFLKSLVS